MKSLTNFAAVMLCGAIFLSKSLFCHAQTTNQVPNVTFGTVTNGVRGELQLTSIQGNVSFAEIAVNVNHIGDKNFIPPDNARYGEIEKNNWGYYMPTNTFCGPIELRDSLGKPLPLLKPIVSATATYPRTYNEMEEHGRYFGSFQFYSGPGIFPMPVFFLSPRTELVRFQIRNSATTNEAVPAPTLYNRVYQLSYYFDLKTPGEYQLTVWPKIYQRSATNHDICVRVDVPPVSIKFKWGVSSDK